MKAVNLEKTVTIIEQINNSYNVFKLKYGCLPGDCIASRLGLGNGTFDGDGNGVYGTGDGLTYTSDEWGNYAIAQIDEAKLVSAPIDNLDVSGSNHIILPLKNTRYRNYAIDGPIDNTIGRPVGVISARIDLSGTNCPPEYYCQGLKPYQTKWIDQKSDDAMPKTGKFIAFGAWTDAIADPASMDAVSGPLNDGVSCSTNQTASEYNNLNTNLMLCNLYIIQNLF